VGCWGDGMWHRHCSETMVCACDGRVSGARHVEGFRARAAPPPCPSPAPASPPQQHTQRQADTDLTLLPPLLLLPAAPPPLAAGAAAAADGAPPPPPPPSDDADAALPFFFLAGTSLLSPSVGQCGSWPASGAAGAGAAGDAGCVPRARARARVRAWRGVCVRPGGGREQQVSRSQGGMVASGPIVSELLWLSGHAHTARAARWQRRTHARTHTHTLFQAGFAGWGGSLGLGGVSLAASCVCGGVPTACMRRRTAAAACTQTLHPQSCRPWRGGTLVRRAHGVSNRSTPQQPSWQRARPRPSTHLAVCGLVMAAAAAGCCFLLAGRAARVGGRSLCGGCR
jgi:hypothetical protein